MKNIIIVVLLSGVFGACHRPVMRATIEQPRPVENSLLTYSLLNETRNVDDLCISAAIDHKMAESGFFKTPFKSDLKIYYRYSFSENLSKKNKKIQVLVIENQSSACIWKGEIVNLPRNITNKEIITYTHLLMQRFEWETDQNNLLVMN